MNASEPAWRPIEGWPNYEVSDDGHVRSRPRERTAGGILKAGRNGSGYWYVALCRDGKVKRVRVHKLVAEAFIGPCPDGQEVRHLNDDKNDNRRTNLAYGTRMENLEDAVRNGRAALGLHNKAKTHCPRRHPYDEANTVYVRGRSGIARVCRTCRAAGHRDDLLPPRQPVPPKPQPVKQPTGPRTHCRRNHEFTPENTYTGPDGRRRCRACGTARFRRRNQREAANATTRRNR